MQKNKNSAPNIYFASVTMPNDWSPSELVWNARISYFHGLTACSFSWWLMAGADLLWEKSTVGWLLVADLFWEKSTAGWWLISQANRCEVSASALITCVRSGGGAIALWSRLCGGVTSKWANDHFTYWKKGLYSTPLLDSSPSISKYLSLLIFFFEIWPSY
jgi:hypothetical protein